ncbi:MAG: VCBS repeat-containing protein [Winogradskyella arenosi]
MRKLIFALSTLALLSACTEQQPTKVSPHILQNLSPLDTGVDFANMVSEDAEHSIINYIYYYNGGGVASGDVNNDGLPDLYFVSNTGENKLYLNLGDLKFKDVSKTAQISGNSSWNTGVTMVDINNDGLLDIYVCAVSGLLDFEGHNELFINNGDGTFTENAKAYGLDFKGYSTQAYFFDYDKDDDLDVYIVNHAVHTTLSHGKAELRHERKPLVGDVLLNNNNGVFEDVSETAKIFGGENGYGLSASIADFNNDGWDDIYVCNDFHEDDYYYLNNQDGTFSEELGKAFSTISRFSMGSDVADINGDGYQDLITLDMLPNDERTLKETEGDDVMFNMQAHLKKLGYKDQYARNMLQLNHQGQYFQETALFNKVAATDWSWSPLFADFNNDGHQDLFITNGIFRRPNSLDFKKYVSHAFRGRSEQEALAWLYNSIGEMPSGKVTNEIYQGNSKQFERQTGQWIEDTPSLSNGSIYVDLDGDGDLELITNNFGAPASIYKNNTDTSKNYIALDFKYKGANQEGIGLKATIYSNNKAQLKQLFRSRGFSSSVNNQLHFGLNEATTIDSLVVVWPNQKVQTIKNPKINQTLTVNYSEQSRTYHPESPSELASTFKKASFIDYTHQEDHYNDFSEEKLIPYRISTLGPALAKADIDNNGYEDIFIGNSSGKKAQLFLNNGHHFTPLHMKAIENDSLFEDNDAEFFDADNDGDLDLYIASGIQEGQFEEFQVDRLYINDNGQFKRSQSQIPLNPLVTTVVSAYDFDSDNDMDLFIGNHSDAHDFGQAVSSYILVNDGTGHFTKQLNFEVESKVTSACWEDINGDQLKDLLVATEWDAPKIFLNQSGNLTPTTVPQPLNGLWQTVSTYDIDKDGDQDILLGNWGLNTKFNLNFDGPLQLYHSDFDQNGKNETLLAYNKGGYYYPLNTKDELASQMNVINRIYTNHKSYAGKTIEEALTKTTINRAEKFEVHQLASGYLRNDHGKFNTFIPFDDALQLAPITTFLNVNLENESQLMVAGNSTKLNSYHGAYTALKGLLLKNEKDYKLISDYGMAPINTQVKQLETLKMKDENLILILSNDDNLQLYTYK